MICKPHFRRRCGRSIAARMARGQQPQQYTPLDVAKLYGLPIPVNGGKLDGSGQTIGVIELGGAFNQHDLSAYLRKLKLPDNQVAILGQMQPDPGGADVEVMLDVCIIAALAPKAAIRVYFAPNTSQDFAAAIAQAVAECDVVSISWGGPESQWSSADRAAMDQAIASGTVHGINVYVAAGDNGSRDGTGSPVTDYPASSPYSVGCGGTNLQPDGSETVWNDGSQGGATGGGYSKYYGQPTYQKGVIWKALRGVPDVAGVADPETGWIIQCNGSLQSVGGTSAVAPMWAAINALLNQQAGKRIGFFDQLAYANTGWFRDTITGSNGDYSASPGWDACTGLGSPNGPKLFGTASGPQPPSPPPPPVSPPSPPPAAGPTIQQVIAVVDADFQAIEQQTAQSRPFLGSIIVQALQDANAQIDQDLQALANGPPSIKESQMQMKDHASLPVAQAAAAETHAEAIDNIFGLPKGTIIGVVTKLLPVILQVLQGVGGAAPTK